MPVPVVESWHLDKRISVSQIIAILSIAVGVFFWVGNVEDGVGDNTQAIQRNAEAIKELTEIVKVHEGKDGHEGTLILLERFETNLNNLKQLILDNRVSDQKQYEHVLERIDKMDARIQRRFELIQKENK